MNTNWLTKIVLSDRTQHLSTKYSIPIKEVRNLLQYDPTKGRYLEWITKNYKSKELRFPEDGSKTIETLTTFTKLYPVLRRNNVSIDINLYSYSDLVRLIEQYGEQKSKREQYRINEAEGVKELLDFPPYKAIQILTPEASAKLCRGTQWCVKDPDYFKDYSDNLIMVLKGGEPYYLLHESSGQYKDTYDRGLLNWDNNPEALEVLKKLYDSGIVKGPVNGDFGVEMLRLLPKDHILNNAKLSYYYAVYVINGRFEEGEATIATSAEWSYQYATEVLENRFELGEAAIATNPEWSFDYAKEILEGRFELGEPTIAKNGYWSYSYARDVIDGRFELGEEAISKHARLSYQYAWYILKGRFELGEPAILNSEYQNLYVNAIINSDRESRYVV